MSLYNNLITLLSKYFYRRDEKPKKYKEWLISEYSNGKWYIGEEAPEIRADNVKINEKEILEVRGEEKVEEIYTNTENIHTNQISNLGSLDSNYPDVIFGAARPLAQCVANQTITIPPYLDSENNIFYSGASWTGTPTQA